MLILDVSSNRLTALPEWLGQLTQLLSLYLEDNQLAALPESLGRLSQLQWLDLQENQLTSLPESLGQLPKLKLLRLDCNQLTALPESLGQLPELLHLTLNDNGLTDLPESLAQLEKCPYLYLNRNPLNPELAAAAKQGTAAVKEYLRERTASTVVLNEAKLVLTGEGAVGKTCLLEALRGDAWTDRGSTHGIEVKPFAATDPDSGSELTLNGWDFGGQKVYRPTHQLFFSAPAVYLVVWKPREGPQQGAVEYWIETIKNRAGPGRGRTSSPGGRAGVDRPAGRRTDPRSAAVRSRR